MIDTAYTDIPSRKDNSEKDEELLTEIRDRYDEYDAQWQDSRKERDKDMRYICGNPWNDTDREARDKAGRPCVNEDQLNQYVSTCVNSLRMNKRGIKVDPAGYGSSENSALLRQDLIRTIEYDSNAPSIYAAAFQAMVEGSYAFFRISCKYVHNNVRLNDPSMFDMHITVKPIANPNSVLFDPYCKEPDWSDAKACFHLERMSRKEFRKQWPRAQTVTFAPDYIQHSASWFPDEDIVVAEYWRIEKEQKNKYLLDTGEVVDSPQGRRVMDKRAIEQKTVKQYVTNGVEILDRKNFPGTILPIIPMIGLERWVDDKGKGQRKLFSLVRLARDPQLALAYLTSQEMEEAGLTPKTPFLGYKGQFDSSRTMWESITKIPHAFLESDIPDNWPAGQVPPLPQRVPFTPNFQEYELAKDSCRRAIQAAMGTMPLPTAMARDNQKSGVALARMQEEQSVGSYHFVDGYDRALRLAGRVIDEWIPTIYDRQRSIYIRQPDDSYNLIHVNTAGPYPDEKTLKPVQYPVQEVDHSISISTGPSYQSQREEANDFLNALVAQMPNLPLAPPQAAQLLSIAIKMKNLGPRGDEMAKIVYPSQDDPTQTMQQMQQLQAQSQQQAVAMQQMQAELQKLTFERQAKLIDNQFELQIEKMKLETQIAVAEINTKSQELKERSTFVADTWDRLQSHAHEAGLTAAKHAHEKEMLASELMADAEGAGAQRAHDALQAGAQRAHEAEIAAADRAAMPEPNQAAPEANG